MITVQILDVQILVSMQDTNFNKPAQFHKALQEKTSLLFDQLSAGKKPLGLKEVVGSVIAEVNSILNVQWLHFVAAVGAVDVSELPDHAKKHIDKLVVDKDIIRKCSSLRSSYIMEALRQLVTGDNRLTKDDYKAAFAEINDIKDDVNVMDFFFVENDLVMISEDQANQFHTAAWLELLQVSQQATTWVPSEDGTEQVKVIDQVETKIGKLVKPFKPVQTRTTPSAESSRPSQGSGENASTPNPKEAKAAPKAPTVVESKSLFDMHKIAAAGAEAMGKGPTFIEATPSTLMAFGLSLKDFVCKKCMSHVGGSDLADQGHYSLHELQEGSKKTLVFKASPGKKLQLSFYGDITDTPVTGCLPVCTAFGKEWFVKAPPHNAMGSALSHYVVPSWLVPTVKGKEVANMWWESHTTQMVFVYTPSNCKHPRSAEIEVKIHTMTLKNDLKGPVKLLRQAMPPMIKTAKEADLLSRNSTTSSLPPKWRAFMYLLS